MGTIYYVEYSLLGDLFPLQKCILILSTMQTTGKTGSLYELCPQVLVKIIALPIKRMTGS